MMYFTACVRYFHIVLAAAALCACSADVPAGDSAVVVEGWIDSGRFPVVMLTRTVPVSHDYQSVDNLAGYIERWARVTVGDGEREVVLVGCYDDNYFPPYVYTTSEMRGEPGRTYSLSVDCSDGTHAEAVTTIGTPSRIDSFAVERVPGNDTLRQVYAYVDNNVTNGAGYKIFTHVVGRKYGYMSAWLGIVSESQMPESGRLAVNRGRINVEKDFTPYFTVGDTVMVKLAGLDGASYRFWRDFEDMTTLSRNPLFPVTNNLHSNIKGGLGYWFGYGASLSSVIVSP